MTLKEKLKTEFPINTEKKSNKFANKCVEIADEFAIGFAEWIFNDWLADERWSKISDEKELLEIYKKEKGL